MAKYITRKTKIKILLNIENLSKPAQNISLIYFYLTLATSMLSTFTSTFLYLYVIDELSLAAFGTIILVQFLVSAFTDFPTGVLADWLGHKWVLAFAYVLFGFGYGILGFAGSTSFEILLLSFVLIAIANGQASGALQSWFDNNYKMVGGEEDPNHETYKVFLGKAHMYFQYGGSIIFLIGGIIASRFPDGRVLAFQIQTVGMFVIAVAFIYYLKGYEKEEKIDEPYFTLLKRGFRFAFSNRLMIFYTMSSVTIFAVGIVWVSLVLYPLYFGYTNSDDLAGTFRWLGWLGSGFAFGYFAKLSKTMDEKVWIPRVSLIAYTTFFGLSALVVYIVSIIPANRNLPVATILLVIFIFAGALMNLNILLTQKFFLEVVPDEMRNSFYSLLPTLGLLVGAVLAPIIGYVIANQGYAFSILILTILALVAVFLEFEALANYEPSHKPEIADQALELYEPIQYDTYSIHNFEASSYHIPRQWQMSSKIKLLWDELIKTAMMDGKITEEERNLLHTIMVNLKSYANLIEQAMSDDIITESERIQLLASRTRLIQDVEAVAMEDLHISPDEHRLINKLIDVLLQLTADHPLEE